MRKKDETHDDTVTFINLVTFVFFMGLPAANEEKKTGEHGRYF